jgi:MarR family transcriptional regulator, 2-MHQ and catechol-resistance regulon repressor
MTAIDPAELAHSALESLTAAESSVRRRLASDLEREGLSSSGFSVLMVLSEHGGELELRALRAKLNTSKANATEVVTTLETRGMVQRFRLAHDRRAASVRLTTQGRELIDRLVPEHTRRVADAFSVLDEAEQQALADICRKLAAV